MRIKNVTVSTVIISLLLLFNASCKTVPQDNAKTHDAIDNVYWVLEVAIKAGEFDNFKELMGEMVEATQANEANTLNYEWTISEDGQSCHIYERYADSAATMTHLGAFGEKFAERFMAAVEPTRFVVYGNPNCEVKEALSGFGPVFMAPFGGFARQ